MFKSIIIGLAVLSFAFALTAPAQASYIIDRSGISVAANGGAAVDYEDPTDAADPSLIGVDLGSYNPGIGDSLTIGELFYDFTALNAPPAGPGAANNDNYFLRASDSITFKLTIDGSTTAYLLTEDFGPGGDKGSFGFNQTTPAIDLLAAVGNTPGTYDVSYEVDYTYHYWSNGNQMVQNTHAPITTAATFTVVPEPATMSLLALGGLAILKRRRNRA
ncbi:MAG: PEP-CTERM sorting domain-containing protein [Phycisphaerales bacterium]|jgi:hypothetical protein|nr:PEP-CTERM sorting domain-containing protein [Phycisphaerales bacterium]